MSAAAPIPGADQYASAEVMANNAYNSALAQLNQNRLNTLTQYGYTGNIDPKTGVLSGVQVDTHSMNGQLQQLLHADALDDQSNQFAAEDRGLHGGLGNQIADAGRYQHGVDATSLGTGLEQQLSDYQDQQQGDAETRDNVLWQAPQAALDAELQNQPSDTLSQLLTGGYGTGSGSTKAQTTPSYTTPTPKNNKQGSQGKPGHSRAARQAKARILRRAGRRRGGGGSGRADKAL
jgi:hypothetical protein